MPEITIDGRRASYFESGAGVPVVLLHAGGSSGKQWTKIARLLDRRFRVIAPDLWGFGNTDSWSGGYELTHDDQAGLVLGLIRDLSDEPVHLVGHSYGGATAVRLLLSNMKLVRSAVLIEPILMRLLAQTGQDVQFKEYVDMAGTFLANAAAGKLDEAWRGFLDYRNGSGTWDALPEPSKERFRGVTESTVTGFRSNLGNPTSLDDLRKLTVRTLVMCGEKTTIPDRRVAEILRDNIPLCRYQVIPGAEHMSPLTHPEFIAEAVSAHIDAAR